MENSLIPWGFLTQVWGEEAKSNVRELWAHTLCPLDMWIQSEAVIEVSGSECVSETPPKKATDWVVTFKGPNVWAQRFSCISCHICLWAGKPLGSRVAHWGLLWKLSQQFYGCHRDFKIPWLNLNFPWPNKYSKKSDIMASNHPYSRPFHPFITLLLNNS